MASTNREMQEYNEKIANTASVSSTADSSRGDVSGHDKEIDIQEEQDLEEPIVVAEAEAGVGNAKDIDLVTAGAVSKKSTKASANDLSKVPNGGLRAWLQVLGSFFLFFNTWGIINTFGVYQTFYELDLLKSSNPSAISWIGSIQAFLLLLVGMLTGPVYDAGYFRELLWGGSFFIVFGHMMLSLTKEYYQVLLAQAFCIGIGVGLLFVPSVAIVTTYFTTKVGFAIGLSAVGSSLGGVLYPIILHKLIPQIGYPWTVRVIGFICLATLSIPLLVLKVRILPDKARPLVDWSAFRQLDLILFTLGLSVGFLGLYSFFFFVQSYAIAKHIMDENLAFYILSILNAASVFGRSIPGLVADRIGPLNVLIPAATMAGVLILCLISVNNTGPLIVIVVLFGFSSGTFVSIPPTVVVYMSTNNRASIGTRLGMCFGCVGVGMLIGPPIQGAILRSSGYNSQWAFGGAVTLGGTALLVVARVVFKGWNLRIKC